MSLNNDAETLLEAALEHAFTAAPVRKEVPQPPASATVKGEHEEVTQPEESTTSEQQTSSDAWKDEYEAHVRNWRAQSAEAREHAEKERAKWEAIRAAEKEEAARKRAESKDSEWESITEKKGESSTVVGPVGESEVQTQTDTTESSQHWEDIHSSGTSSFPSMTFPERTATPSPPLAPARKLADAPKTATLAIFDSSLPARTRVKAVLASLAINLLLPFVNGVMLGFGEVFAKNVVVGWFGWKQPGSVAASTGIRAADRRRSIFS